LLPEAEEKMIKSIYKINLNAIEKEDSRRNIRYKVRDLEV